MKILITGGTSHLGRQVARIGANTHDIRILSRQAHSPEGNIEWVQGDIALGEGVLEAATGIEAIVHLASDPRQPKAVDVEGTKHLIEAAQKARIGHLFYISIVGIDEIPLRYYKCKLEAEKIIEASGVPFSILRATQFHSLLDSMVSGAMRFPWVAPLPTNFKFQGVAEEEVAQHLVQCLTDGPGGRLPDLGGPEVLSFGEIAQTWMEVKGNRKKLIHLPLPGALAAAFRAGKNTTPQGVRGTMTWRQWLTR
jgi:uncharacterized protein YbjT (DUF2867 family)